MPVEIRLSISRSPQTAKARPTLGGGVVLLLLPFSKAKRNEEESILWDVDQTMYHDHGVDTLQKSLVMRY